MYPFTKKTRSFNCLTLCGVILLVFASLCAARDIKITVNSGANQTWKGFGVMPGSDGYGSVDAATRERISSMLFNDMKFTFLMLYSQRFPHSAACPDGYLGSKEIYDAYKSILSDSKKIKNDIILVYGPHQCSNIHRDPQKWSDYVVNTIRDLKDTYEMHINFIDMYAEPEPGSFGPAPKDWPQVVKLIRQKLDGNGLNDVKIVAPSLSGVDPSSGGIARLAPLLGDRDAVKSLDMFGFHSYRMSMVKNQRDRLLNAGLTEGFFVTEGGDENCDAGNAVCKGKYYDTRLRANPKYDVSIMGNVLNDINLGTSYWTWFAGTQPIRSIRDARYNSVEGLAILRFGINRIDIYPKYYHLVQFSQAIKVGSKIRLSTSDLGEEDRYIYMEAGYGNRPNIHAVAGQNIDGGWGIALLNMSGSPVSKWGRTVVSNWPAAETQKVTVHVEELALKGDMQFHVYRTIVSDWRNTKKERSIIMRNGNVEVTLQAGDMVTLQTKAATGIIMQ